MTCFLLTVRNLLFLGNPIRLLYSMQRLNQAESRNDFETKKCPIYGFPFSLNECEDN